VILYNAVTLVHRGVHVRRTLHHDGGRPGQRDDVYSLYLTSTRSSFQNGLRLHGVDPLLIARASFFADQRHIEIFRE
jgi:hypothetical protein